MCLEQKKNVTFPIIGCTFSKLCECPLKILTHRSPTQKGRISCERYIFHKYLPEFIYFNSCMNAIQLIKPNIKHIYKRRRCTYPDSGRLVHGVGENEITVRTQRHSCTKFQFVSTKLPLPSLFIIYLATALHHFSDLFSSLLTS